MFADGKYVRYVVWGFWLFFSFPYWGVCTEIPWRNVHLQDLISCSFPEIPLVMLLILSPKKNLNEDNHDSLVSWRR